MTQGRFSQKHMNRYNMHMEFIIYRSRLFRGETEPQGPVHITRQTQRMVGASASGHRSELQLRPRCINRKLTSMLESLEHQQNQPQCRATATQDTKLQNSGGDREMNHNTDTVLALGVQHNFGPQLPLAPQHQGGITLTSRTPGCCLQSGCSTGRALLSRG